MDEHTSPHRKRGQWWNGVPGGRWSTGLGCHACGIAQRVRPLRGMATCTELMPVWTPRGGNAANGTAGVHGFYRDPNRVNSVMLEDAMMCTQLAYLISARIMLLALM